MFRSFLAFGLFVFIISHASIVFACADSDMNDTVSNARWCKQQCDGSSGRQNQCNGSGRMERGVRASDINAVREGFEWCHDGNQRLIDQMNDCQRTRPQVFLDRISKEVYGFNRDCKRSEEISESFDVILKPNETTESKRDLIGEISASKQGKIKAVSPRFFRDNKVRGYMAMVSFSFNENGGKTSIEIKTEDRRTRNVSLHKYRASGSFVMIVERPCN